MANTNLNLVLNGKDNISSTLKNVQNELQGIKDKGKQLDSIQKDFDVITNSSKSMRTQLRQIQTLMAQMNLDGLDNTPLFTQMAQRAGELSDAIGDARTAVSAFANDNFKLEAMAQGMTLVASAGSIATGVMGMFGTENEKVTQAILKVQSALAILNGVQQVANVLNKDSALMLRLKQIRMIASTASTKENTVATTANTVAENLSGVTLKKNTIIQNAWNVAKAVAKALLGDWTGLLLVGAAALTTYAIATSGSKDELEKESEATKKAKEQKEEYVNTVASSTAKLVSKFKDLKDSYSKMRTEGEKTQWIKENKTELHNLGLKINDVISADKVFVSNSDKVIKAFELRAKAAALATLQTQAYEDYYKKTLNAETNFKAGTSNTFGGNGDTQKLWHNFINSKKSSEWKDLVKDGKLTQKGADEFSDFVRKQGKRVVTKESLTAASDLKKELEGIDKELNIIQKDYDKLGISSVVSLTPDIDNNKDGNKNNNKKKEEVIDKNSVKYAEQELKKFEEKKLKIPIDEKEQLQKNQQEIDYWKAELERRKIKVELDSSYSDEKLNELQEQLKTLVDRKKEQINLKVDTTDIDKKISDVNKKIDELNSNSTLDVKTKDEQLNKLNVELEQLKKERYDITVGIDTKETDKELSEILRLINNRKAILNLDLKYDGSLQGLNDKLRDLQTLRLTLNPDDTETIQMVNDEIKKVEKQVEDAKVILGINPKIEEGSKSYLEKQISELEKQLDNMDISLNPEKYNDLMNKLIELLDKKKEVEKSLSTDSLASIQLPDNSRFSKGSFEDKRQSYDNTMSMINQVGNDYANSLIDKEDAQRQIDELIAQLQAEFPEIELKFKVNDDGTITQIKKNVNGLSDALGGVGSAVSSMGQAMSNLAGENEGLAKAALITSAIGQLVLSFATSMKGSVTVWDWIAGAVAGVATLTSVIAQMQSFESGGIVGGTSFSGDRTLIRANAGEMVLNKAQQNNLYKAIKNNNLGGNNNTGGKVEFVIDGRNLKGVLNNVNNKLSKQS